MEGVRTSSSGSADLVALLFTDIEGSSLRWLNHRAAMQEAVRQHDEILKTSIAGHGGEIFKTGGDAFHAVFRRPSDAVGAAMAAQQSLAGRDWKAVDGLRVRMAVHVGTAERRENDYFGPALNRAARLLALGHGGQLLVSSSAAELIAAEREHRCALRLIGAHSLDDPTQVVDVYQADLPGMQTDFPPLKTEEARPTNLPRQLTPLIGRDVEMQRLRSLIESHSLVTLTGTGGVGKTRMTLEAGAQLVDRFRDGAWLVELAAITDPAMVPTAVTTALGIEATHERSPLDALVKRLKNEELLLLLDNCEHVIDAVAKLIEALLGAAPRVRVLSSSQEPIGIAGEQVFRLPSLHVPDDPGVKAAAAMHAGAVQLFVERATAVDPRFVLDDRSAPVVAAICRRLDGIPLAIEMAASRAPMLGVQKLAEKLDERFRVLTGGRRTALPRQQTLRATLDWSYGLLADRERVVLRRASIFAGGFTLEAASAVVADETIDEFEVIDLLSHLVTRSMIVADTQDHRTRYRLLETTRAYALEALAAAGETAALERRHANHFARVFEESDVQWDVLTDLQWSETYAPERDNLRTALDWAFSPEGDPGLGIALPGSARRLWVAHSLHAEARERLTVARQHVAHCRSTGDEARLYLAAAAVDRDPEAVEQMQRALELYRGRGDDFHVFECLIRLVARFANMGRPRAAQAAHEDAKLLVPTIHSARALGFYHEAVGFLHNAQNADSPLHYQAALDFYRKAGAERMVLLALANVTDMDWAAGNLDAAIAGFRELVGRIRQSPVGSRAALGVTLDNLFGALTEKGDLDGAAAQLREALALSAGDPTGFQSFDHVALHAALRGQFSTAAQLEGYCELAHRNYGWESRQPNEERARRRTLTLLEANLSPVELERLLSEGARLSQAEAERLALGLCPL